MSDDKAIQETYQFNEPWQTCTNGVDATTDKEIFYLVSERGEIVPDEETMDRIATCVNFCAGFSTEGMKSLGSLAEIIFDIQSYMCSYQKYLDPEDDLSSFPNKTYELATSVYREIEYETKKQILLKRQREILKLAQSLTK